MYLSIQQVSKKLHKSERQIRYMIKQEQIMPVNPDTYRRDGGYRFKEEEIDYIKQTYEPNGLTVKDAAKRAGISPQYLMQFVRKGEVESFTKIIGKQKRRFFELEEIDRFKDRLQERTVSNREGEYGSRVQLISREVRIFDKVRINGVMTRVVSTSPLKILMSNGKEIHIHENIQGKGKWPDRDYIKQKGFAEFSIPIPRNMDHPVYDLLYKIIFQLGKNNTQIYETDLGDFYVRCRLGQLKITEDELQLLLRYIEKGEIHYNPKTLVAHLTSGFTTISFDIPTKILDRYREEAEELGLPMEELFQKALRRYL
ncbi:helix-turn-helix domain-containing protein [Pontibacillus sp. ALD_SL1]|uniref:helix-turn-helix domain-containing protein n=1 Tax=Pontibacillus sp. ALD_SL1 TaxID=2777185 RepID=UPI001A97A038|nr:helix-turn-helix domain-containing protein [Pontibacillus sp. ALD_SL1]QSS98376.1 helix-turn-helix domain-containing protein [Pontibacillus sp. ALD_SL1]